MNCENDAVHFPSQALLIKIQDEWKKRRSFINRKQFELVQFVNIKVNEWKLLGKLSLVNE